MPLEIDRPHWSYSSISQYLKCPLQFYFERILKLPKKTTSDAQVLGSSLHAALALYHRQLHAREPVPERQVQEVFLTAWESHDQRTEIVHASDRSTADNLALGVALIETYLKEPSPTNILAIEQSVLAPITNSRGEVLERPLLVVPDLVTRQEDSTLKVNEIKTSGRAYSQSEVATSLQPTCYASALYELTGEEPIVELTILVKTKVPRVQRIEAARTIPDFGRLGDLVEVVEQAVEAEIFYPQESPLNCSTCPFFRECREWTGPGTSKSGYSQVHPIEEACPC
jgi:CRISPR/Cas system-associated exonuclease Cas4 (RecB family)